MTAMISYLTGSNIQFPALDCVSLCPTHTTGIRILTLPICVIQTSPVIGIVFCMIIVRVGLGLGHQGHTIATSQTLAAHHPSSAASSRWQEFYPMRPVQMQPLAVNITQDIQSRGDADDRIVVIDSELKRGGDGYMKDSVLA